MTRPPKLATTTFGKGSAAKQDAIRKGRVAASKAKLDALIARQEEAENWGPCPECNRRPADPDYGVCLEREGTI